MKTTFVTILVLISLAGASIIDLDRGSKLTSVKAEISHLVATGAGSTSLVELESMQAEASRIAEMVYTGNCESHSINTVESNACKTLPTRYDAFMQTYQKLTQKIYLSRLAMMKQSASWKDSVDRCVEGLGLVLAPDMMPDQLFAVNLSVDAQPIDDQNVSVQYKFHYKDNEKGYNSVYENEHEFKPGEYKKIMQRFVKWHTQCIDVVRYRYDIPNKVGAGSINEYFTKKAQDYWKNSPYVIYVNSAYSEWNGIRIGIKKMPRYAVVTRSAGKVVDQFEITWGAPLVPDLNIPNPTGIKRYMYIDNLDKDEIRFQLGSPDQHAIYGAGLMIDGKEGMTRETVLPIADLQVSIEEIK